MAPAGSIPLGVYNDAGVQLTSGLKNSAGTNVTTVTSDANGDILFFAINSHPRNLWVRVLVNGSPTGTAYRVTVGQDDLAAGTGTVTSINGVQPTNGAVNLSPANIGAATQTDMTNVLTRLDAMQAAIDQLDSSKAPLTAAGYVALSDLPFKLGTTTPPTDTGIIWLVKE
jgi:hypothetical protein